MVTKAKPKPAAKKPAAKKPGTQVILWEKELAAAAQHQAKGEKPTGTFKRISTRGGILAVDEVALEDNELRCVVLMAAPENQLYDGPFDPDSPQAPMCYAFGDPEADDPEEGMKPHEQAKHPQHGDCATCEFNEFGSADKGRGKACKNVRRMAVITEDALESVEALEEAEVRMLKVPVLSVKGWKKYVHKLSEEMQRPSWAVITLLKIVPDPKSQFRLQFTFEELINFDQAMFDGIKAKIAGLKAELLAPYPDLEETAAKPAGKRPTPKGARAAPAKKTPTKRKY